MAAALMSSCIRQRQAILQRDRRALRHTAERRWGSKIDALTVRGHTDAIDTDDKRQSAVKL